MELIASRSIALFAGAPQLKSPTVNLGALTSSITVSLQRPTTAQPVPDWSASGVVRVSLVLIVDGVEYRCVGTARGGIRTDRFGQEVPAYTLTYQPTVLFGDRARQYLETAVPDQDGYYTNVPLTRVGETGTTVQGYLLLERLSGRIETTLTVAATREDPAPVLPRHKNSVAFDAATSANEASGDGVLSLSHTASGTNRAAFIGAGSSGGAAQPSTSATYAGNSATEKWDVTPIGSFGNAGYVIAGDGSVPTGAQTVSNTLAGSRDEHGLAVVSFTGVDSGTPTGTAVTASGSSNAPSVTVSSPAADSMVVDFAYVNSFNPSVGANQTERTKTGPIGGWTYAAASTQAGSDGGVMSWSLAGTETWTVGAIEMKAAGDAEAAHRILAPNKLRPAAFAPGLAR